MIGRRRFVDVNIERRAGHFAFADGVREILLIDDAAAGAVDDTHAGLHLGEGVSIDQPLGFRRKRYMDGDEIGFGEDLFQGRRLDAHAGDVFRGDERIEADHFHSEPGGAFGDDPADIAETDDAEGLVAQLHADEFVAVPFAAFEGGDCLRNMARQGHHERNRMLAGGYVVAAGGVHDDDPFFAGGIDVDVFETDAGPPDDF